MNLFEFMSDSPILSFFLAFFICQMLLNFGSRVMRTLNVVVRGWPPAHLDADGDWKPESTDD